MSQSKKQDFEDAQSPKAIKPGLSTTEDSDIDWKSYVAKYNVPVEFPFEIGETVYVLKPTFRSTLGPFQITKALSNNRFELTDSATGALHSEEVEARYLRRDANALS